MHLYEVNLDIDAAIEADYLAWLRDHVAEILALDGFEGAQVRRVLEPPAPGGRAHFSVLYRLRDAAALDDYLRLHAPRLREDGQRRFGGRFSASRRVLSPLGAD